MGDFASWAERRRSLRVPVRGVAVFSSGSRRRATIENLSTTGALLDVMGLGGEDDLERARIELKLGTGSGRVIARTVRIDKTPRRTRIAIAFDDIDPGLRETIRAAIEDAIAAAHRRPVLVIDDDRKRRDQLTRALTREGMSPFSATTPLEAINLLSRNELHVSVCLLAPSFGHTTAQLRALVSDSFPWVWTAEIADDVEATVARATLAWSGTEMGRFARAIA